MTELETRYGNRILSQRGILLDNYCVTKRTLEFVLEMRKTAQRDRIVKELRRVIKETKSELLEEPDLEEIDEDMRGRLGI